MMEIAAKRDAKGLFSLSAKGHAGFAEAGSDIVCAAVSTLLQAFELGLKDVLNVQGAKILSRPEIPEMVFEWDSGDHSAQQLAQTIFQSLKAVANSYTDYMIVLEEDYEQ